MKKFIVIFALLLLPLAAGASFDNNLYYGLQNNNEVKEMQEFLTEQKVYDGPITGNFYSLTLKAVKDFQKKENISPTSGFFGPLTRTKANEVLSANVEPSNQQAVQETGTTPPTPEPAKTTNDVVKSLQDQIALLLQQIQSMQAQQTTLNQIQQNTQQTAQNTQQIVQNTTPPACTTNWQCGSWNTCTNSQQTRTCTDSNNCGTTTGKPIETQSCVMPPEPLAFAETPKLVWRGFYHPATLDRKAEFTFGLSYTTWKTNRPSKLILGPVLPNPTIENPEDWTTQFQNKTFESCVRYGVSRSINSNCKIVVKDDLGQTAEYQLSIFNDSINLCDKDTPNVWSECTNLCFYPDPVRENWQECPK